MGALLNFLKIIIIAATTSVFTPSNNFVVNNKNEAAVQIACLNDAFQTNFINLNEGPEAKHSLRKCFAAESFYFSDATKELGNSRIDCSLSDIWALLKLQPKGEPGELGTTELNVFFVRDGYDNPWSILVVWTTLGWCINAYAPDSGMIFDKGTKVFVYQK
jgi:hypothetical protein